MGVVFKTTLLAIMISTKVMTIVLVLFVWKPLRVKMMKNIALKVWNVDTVFVVTVWKRRKSQLAHFAEVNATCPNHLLKILH
jgi:hypothetical protein